MFLDLTRTKLDVFQVSKEFVLACYKETKTFPSEEKFGITSQVRRSVLSVHLNIAEGCSGKSTLTEKDFTNCAWIYY